MEESEDQAATHLTLHPEPSGIKKQLLPDPPSLSSVPPSLSLSRGGRSYIPVSEQLHSEQPKEMRSKQTEVFLLGSTLSQISSSGKLPVKGDVQRYLKGRITRNKRGVKPETLICCPLNSQTKVACCDDLDRGCQKSGDRCVVAELKQDSWLKSGYAIKDDHEITKMILRDYEKLKILVKHKSKTSQVAEEERKSFRLEMSKLLDIARYDAEDIIMKDKLRSKEAKEEDLSFLKDQRSERKGKVSVIDKKHQQAVSTKQIKVKAFEVAKEKTDELKLVYEAKKLDYFNVGTEDTDDDTYNCDVMSS